MNVPFELSAFIDRLASDAGLKLSLALVHFLWQGVLIAAAAALLMRVVGRKTSQRRYLIGVVAMSAMAVAPIVTFCLVEPPDWSQFITNEEPSFDLSGLETADLDVLLATLETDDVRASEVLPEAPPRPLTWPERIRLYQPYALLLWLCGTGLFALRLGVGLHASWRFGRGRAALPEGWRNIAERVASQLGVSTPRIFVSERIVEAVAVGLLKPMVLLPAAWIGNVPLDVLEAVLAHEIAHLRRYDLWVNLLQRCVEAALFYHPAVWWLSRRIRQEREYCCDEVAATVVSGRAAYARALEFVATERVAGTQRTTFAAAFAAGMGGSHMALLDRVRRVLGSDVKPNRGTWLSEGLLALAVPAALWACIATVAPNVATADDGEKATRKEDAASADAHIGDIEYWKEHGIDPGMITVLKDGELVDLATGDSVDRARRTIRQNFTARPLLQSDATYVDVPLDLIDLSAVTVDDVAPQEDGDDVTKALRELREEMQSLRKELDELRGKRPSTAKPAEIEYRIRKLPPVAGGKPVPPPLPVAPHVKVDRLIRVAPLEIDGKKVNVIVEEFREGEGPAKEIQLRILKPTEPGEAVYADPAEGEKARKKAEEARTQADDVARKTRIYVDRKQMLEDAERAARESLEQLEKARANMQRTRDMFAPGHPRIREAEQHLEHAEKQRERHTRLHRALQGHPYALPEDVAREVDVLINRRMHGEKPEEAEQRLQEMQRQLEEQKKTIEELQKKLEGQEQERERQSAAIRPLIDEYNQKINARDYAAAIEIAKKAREAAPAVPETITLLYKAKVLYEEQRNAPERRTFLEKLRFDDAEESERETVPDTKDDPAADATDSNDLSMAGFDFRIPALSIGTMNEFQKAFTFYVGVLR